jgi:hypothetical protein
MAKKPTLADVHREARGVLNVNIVPALDVIFDRDLLEWVQRIPRKKPWPDLHKIEIQQGPETRQ